MVITWWGRTENLEYSITDLGCHHGDKASPEEVFPVTVCTDASTGFTHRRFVPSAVIALSFLTLWV